MVSPQVNLHQRGDVKRAVGPARGGEPNDSPFNPSWDSFFKNGSLPTPDLMSERATQVQPDRERL